MEEGDEEGNDRRFEVRIVEIDEEKEGEDKYSIREETFVLKRPEWITGRDEDRLAAVGAVDPETGEVSPEGIEEGNATILSIAFIDLDSETAKVISREDRDEMVEAAGDLFGEVSEEASEDFIN